MTILVRVSNLPASVTKSRNARVREMDPPAFDGKNFWDVTMEFDGDREVGMADVVCVSWVTEYI